MFLKEKRKDAPPLFFLFSKQWTGKFTVSFLFKDDEEKQKLLDIYKHFPILII